MNKKDIDKIRLLRLIDIDVELRNKRTARKVNKLKDNRDRKLKLLDKIDKVIYMLMYIIPINVFIAIATEYNCPTDIAITSIYDFYKIPFKFQLVFILCAIGVIGSMSSYHIRNHIWNAYYKQAHEART